MPTVSLWPSLTLGCAKTPARRVSGLGLKGARAFSWPASHVRCRGHYWPLFDNVEVTSEHNLPARMLRCCCLKYNTGRIEKKIHALRYLFDFSEHEKNTRILSVGNFRRQVKCCVGEKHPVVNQVHLRPGSSSWPSMMAPQLPPHMHLKCSHSFFFSKFDVKL